MLRTVATGWHPVSTMTKMRARGAEGVILDNHGEPITWGTEEEGKICQNAHQTPPRSLLWQAKGLWTVGVEKSERCEERNQE